MDYAYFSFTTPQTKENGLKIVVAFVHERFQLEVWLSGINRSMQCRWAQQLKICLPPMEATSDPAHTDYLVRMPVQADLSCGEAAAAAVKTAAKGLVQLLL